MSSPLHCAAKNGNTERIVQLLKVGNHDVDGRTAVYASTPLSLALRWGHQTSALALIDHGADINLADMNGITPLHTAAESGSTEVVRYLVERGVDVSCATQWGHEPLHCAATNGNKLIMDLLIQSGANVNCRGSGGQTPLHRVVCNNLPHLISFLVNRGAEINSVDANGWSPLHSAAYFHHYAAVSVLIERYGANATLRDNTGRTPLKCFATLTGDTQMKATFDCAMSKYEHARLLALVVFLQPLGLPVLVVYKIYSSLPHYQTHVVSQFRAWELIKQVKHTRFSC